jgi:hypothetical protein
VVPLPEIGDFDRPSIPLPIEVGHIHNWAAGQ